MDTASFLEKSLENMQSEDYAKALASLTAVAFYSYLYRRDFVELPTDESAGIRWVERERARIQRAMQVCRFSALNCLRLQISADLGFDCHAKAIYGFNRSENSTQKHNYIDVIERSASPESLRLLSRVLGEKRLEDETVAAAWFAIWQSTGEVPRQKIDSIIYAYPSISIQKRIFVAVELREIFARQSSRFLSQYVDCTHKMNWLFKEVVSRGLVSKDGFDGFADSGFRW